MDRNTKGGKKMPKRVTPEQEFDRLAERIYNEHGENIVDRDTFDVFFNRYMGSEDITRKRDVVLREKTFDYYAKNHSGVSTERIHEEAGGKNLAVDMAKTAKTIVTDKKQYRKLGAGKVDLKGYDTKPKFKKKLDVTARVKGKIVYATQDTVIIKGHKITVYRDRKGRFAKKIR